MRAVGIKALKNKLSEYVRVAADALTEEEALAALPECLRGS